MIPQDAVRDLIVLGGIMRPVHGDAIRACIGLELLNKLFMNSELSIK